MANEVILFGDIEAALVAYLDTKTTATVAASIPHDRTEPLVVAQRIGGIKRDLVTDAATIRVHCWHTLPSDALELAQLMRAHIHALRGEFVSGLHVQRIQDYAGPSLLPDPESSVPRYSFTVSVEYRGEATS